MNVNIAERLWREQIMKKVCSQGHTFFAAYCVKMTAWRKAVDVVGNFIYNASVTREIEVGGER